MLWLYTGQMMNNSQWKYVSTWAEMKALAECIKARAAHAQLSSPLIKDTGVLVLFWISAQLNLTPYCPQTSPLIVTDTFVEF